MLKLKFPLQRPKTSRTQKKTSFKRSQQTQQIARLHMKMVDTESKLQQSHKLNDLYLSQIRQLENDNLDLCQRLHEVKVLQQRTIRQYIEENDKLKGQVKELLKVVEVLERDNSQSEKQIQFLNMRLKQCTQQSQIGKNSQLRTHQLVAELQRSKVKLLESQKYWITRCQTLLAEQRTENQKVSIEKETEYMMKIKILTNELNLKHNQVQQKTKEIYKLIQHIQTLSV